MMMIVSTNLVTFQGEGCARSGYPGVYARISHAYDWIRQVACGCWGSTSATLCKGFVDNGEECPTAPPVFVYDPNCSDFVDYTDEFGDTCEWFVYFVISC